MEDNHFKTLCFLLRCVLLFLQLAYSINHEIGAAASQPEVFDRLSKIEAQNLQHEKEISILKTEKAEDKKKVRKLRERVAHLENSAFSNNLKGDKIIERSKRPASLLPDTIGQGKNVSAEDNDKRFYGPPTSCKELQKLGYTLNGYYLIKGKDESNSSRIRVTYCRFYQPALGENNKQTLETLIGNVEVKTRSVHFYAYRENHFRNVNFNLNFQNEELNVGRAINLTTGEFTAPVNGIYHFEFSCLKPGDDSKKISVYLKVHKFGSENPSYVASTFMANVSNRLSGSLTASLRLKLRDRVYLATYGEGKLYDNFWGRYTQFVGWLVEEDLAL